MEKADAENSVDGLIRHGNEFINPGRLYGTAILLYHTLM